jgi:hypothetical protein
VLYEVAGRRGRARDEADEREPAEEQKPEPAPEPIQPEPEPPVIAKAPAPPKAPTPEPEPAGPQDRSEARTVNVPVPGIQPAEESGGLGSFLADNPLVPIGLGAAILIVVAVMLWNRPPTPASPQPSGGETQTIDEALRGLGPESEPAPAPPTTDETTGQSAEPVAAGASEGPEPPAPPPERPTVELRRGYHYVVVQHFPKRHRDHAERAARFLQDNGLSCALLSGADIRLVIAEPFLIDQDDRAASRRERKRGEALVQRVKELGKEYRKHGYAFEGAALREIH